MKKPPKDINKLAAMIVEVTTQGTEKNSAAVTLGRMGGLKGGISRANKLSSERRSEIAKLGAAKRWDKTNK